MKQLNIYACGTLIEIKDMEQKGFITGISIRDNYIKYEISYFYKHEYKQIWMNLYEFEIISKNPKTFTIGFRDK